MAIEGDRAKLAQTPRIFCSIENLFKLKFKPCISSKSLGLPGEIKMVIKKNSSGEAHMWPSGKQTKQNKNGRCKWQ